MMSINAVKGVEIGEGMAAAALTGSANADEIAMGRMARNLPRTTRAASSAESPPGRRSCAFRGEADLLDPDAAQDDHRHGEETEIVTKGRHDPCVGIRAVPVGEAMMACVLLDHLLLHRGQVGAHRIGGPPRRPQSGPAPIIPSPDCRHIRFGSSVSHLICLERGA
jgi:chorismate synthase